MSTAISAYFFAYKVNTIFAEWSFIFQVSKQIRKPPHSRGFLLSNGEFEGASPLQTSPRGLPPLDPAEIATEKNVEIIFLYRIPPIAVAGLSRRTSEAGEKKGAAARPGEGSVDASFAKRSVFLPPLKGEVAA